MVPKNVPLSRTVSQQILWVCFSYHLPFIQTKYSIPQNQCRDCDKYWIILKHAPILISDDLLDHIWENFKIFNVIVRMCRNSCVQTPFQALDRSGGKDVRCSTRKWKKEINFMRLLFWICIGYSCCSYFSWWSRFRMNARAFHVMWPVAKKYYVH